MLDNSRSDCKVKWLRNPKRKGEFLFTIDGVRIYNLFRDYPHALSTEDKNAFDAENPFWVDYFKDRQK